MSTEWKAIVLTDAGDPPEITVNQNVVRLVFSKDVQDVSVTRVTNIDPPEGPSDAKVIT